MRPREIILGLTVTIWSTVALGQERQPVFFGVIEGQVLNVDGATVPQADVCAIPVGALNQSALPRSRANGLGQFSIHIQKLGRYLIAASQEKEGYGSAFFQAYGVQALPPPEVLIDEGQPRQSVVIRLGPNLGSLTGRVLDAETNQPVERGQVELQLRSHQMALTRLIQRGNSSSAYCRAFSASRCPPPVTRTGTEMGRRSNPNFSLCNLEITKSSLSGCGL